MIRGWFEFDGGAQMIAVSWNAERKAWVNLMGGPVPKLAKLTHWGAAKR